MKAIVTGSDERDLSLALESEGVTVVRIEGVVTGDALDAAEIASADLLVVTDVEEVTAVSVARERNPDLRVVVYSTDSVPEFARGIIDLALDPALLSPDIVAEELV